MPYMLSMMGLKEIANFIKGKGFFPQDLRRSAVRFYSKLPIPELELTIYIYKMPPNKRRLSPYYIQMEIRVCCIENIIERYHRSINFAGGYVLPALTFFKHAYPTAARRNLDKNLLIVESNVFDRICNEPAMYYKNTMDHIRNFTIPTDFPEFGETYSLKRTATLWMLEETYEDIFVQQILKENPSSPNGIKEFWRYIDWLKKNHTEANG
jgi:hypothetical protein